jgi:hypothetical protein
VRDKGIPFGEVQNLWKPFSKTWLIPDHRRSDAMERHVELIEVVHFFWWAHEVDD